MTSTFSAWRIARYGGPERLTPVTVPMPTPGPGEILIRIHASAVSRADGMMRAGRPRFARAFLGLRRPRRNLSGTGLSGEVIAVGEGVRRFAVGDAVFGEAGLNFGANASHICLNEGGTLMHKPATLSHKAAAVMCDGPLTSYHFLLQVAQLRAGQRGGADRGCGRRRCHCHLQQAQPGDGCRSGRGAGGRLHHRGCICRARSL